MVLDSNLASAHLRQCINDLKRERSSHPAFMASKVKVDIKEEVEKVRVILLVFASYLPHSTQEVVH